MPYVTIVRDALIKACSRSAKLHGEVPAANTKVKQKTKNTKVYRRAPGGWGQEGRTRGVGSER